MSKSDDLAALDRELAGLSDRVAALRATRTSVPSHDAWELIDALFVEFETAEEELRVCRDELSAKSGKLSASQHNTDRDRRLLRAVFTELPAPVFLLNEDGSVRRVNQAAAELLETSATYLTGKPVSAFVDMRSRATFRSHLSAVLRGKDESAFSARVTSHGWRKNVHLQVARIDLPEDPKPVVAMVAWPDASPEQFSRPRAAVNSTASTAGAPSNGYRLDEQIARAATLRLQVMTRMTRLLLDEESLREPVPLRRAARLLSEELADWVIIDLVHGGELRRTVVNGPQGQTSAYPLEDLVPAQAPLLAEVMEDGSSKLVQTIDDEHVLGTIPQGWGVLTALGAGSIACMPLRHQDRLLGVATLVRTSDRASLDIADLGLMEELGEHLGLALEMERKYQRRSDAAETMQASLLPRLLPSIPGIDAAATYRPATEGANVGGDFYDVFDTGDGFGFVLGDVCGKGVEAATVAAAIRNWVQLLGLSESEPARVLRQVNRAMHIYYEADRFATAVTGRLRWNGAEEQGNEGSGQGRVQVWLASAGHPRAIVLRADGTARFAAGGGLPLGLFPETEPAVDAVELGPQDTLLLYSDGVTDSRAGDGGFYTEQRLADSLSRAVGLPASAVVKEIEDDLQRHGSSADDVAILVFRVNCAEQ